MKAELAPLERAAQLETHLRARAGALVDVGGEELEGVAPGLFGAVHRGVGRAEQRLGVVAVGGEGGDADARRNHDFLALDGGRRGEPGGAQSRLRIVSPDTTKRVDRRRVEPVSRLDALT